MGSRDFGERDRAVLDALLKQYEFLRAEIIQSIYLKHAAIIGLYSFLGAIIVILTREVLKENSSPILKPILEFRFFDLVNFDLGKTIPFLSILIFVQIIVSGFGSLYLKEQARNRRACSFQKAIEYLINEKIGEIGVYWENYITSELIDKKFEIRDLPRFSIPVHPEYYKNRLLGVGLPVFLPNFFITPYIYLTFLIGLLLYALDRENLIFLITFITFLLFVVSLLITYLWAWMILERSQYSLKEENMPSGEDVFKWLKRERTKILLTGVSSTFTIKHGKVEIEVHVSTKGLSERIYNIEIFPDDQDPRWKSVEYIEGAELPAGWACQRKIDGVRFYTEDNPLKECEPVKFRLKIRPEEIVKDNKIHSIRVHLTDKNRGRR